MHIVAITIVVHVKGQIIINNHKTNWHSWSLHRFQKMRSRNQLMSLWHIARYFGYMVNNKLEIPKDCIYNRIMSNGNTPHHIIVPYLYTPKRTFTCVVVILYLRTWSFYFGVWKHNEFPYWLKKTVSFMSSITSPFTNLNINYDNSNT